MLTSHTLALCVSGAKPLQGGWVPGPHLAEQPEGPPGALFGNRGALSTPNTFLLWLDLCVSWENAGS